MGATARCAITMRLRVGARSGILHHVAELDALHHDALKRPELFRWEGALERRAVEEWIGREGLVVPCSLQELWIETGGGTLFETEELLAPFGDELPFLRARRMLIFHQGICDSAVDQSTGGLVLLGHSGATPVRDLAAWYFVLRDEFGDRYGFQRRRT